MKIDFKAEVEKRKQQIIKDTIELLKINSELTVFNPESPAPFGPGIKKALDFMLELGEKDGFNTLNLDGYAGHIELGSQDEYVGMIGHLDVVPAGENWKFAPYEATINDGKIYARGAEDDKGPTMAAYYAMKILKELELPLSKRIKLIIGTDEETSWRCVNYYFKKLPEQPVYGFIPDAEFPLTYAEKGILNIKVKVKAKESIIHNFSSGRRVNMVPDYASVSLSDLSYKESFLKYLKDNNYQGEAKIEEGLLKLSISGLSGHGSTPQDGVNAAFLLINFLNQALITNEFIDLVNTYLLDDLEGKKIGIDYHDEETGFVTLNAGLFTQNNNTFEITINIRYPNGVEPDEFIKKTKLAFNSLDAEVEVLSHQKRLYINPNSKLVQTLYKIYQKHTGDTQTGPLTTGGGTFARAMENSVAFGPHFPGKASFIHQNDEYIEIDDLLMQVAIYAESLYELAK